MSFSELAPLRWLRKANCTETKHVGAPHVETYRNGFMRGQPQASPEHVGSKSAASMDGCEVFASGPIHTYLALEWSKLPRWASNLPWKNCGNSPKLGKLCRDSCKYHLLKRVCEERTIREAPDIIVVVPWHAAGLPSLLLLETFGNPSRNHGIPRQRNFSRRLWDCTRSWTRSPQALSACEHFLPWGKGSLLHHASPAWCSQPATADWRWRGD